MSQVLQHGMADNTSSTTLKAPGSVSHQLDCGYLVEKGSFVPQQCQTSSSNNHSSEHHPMGYCARCLMGFHFTDGKKVRLNMKGQAMLTGYTRQTQSIAKGPGVQAVSVSQFSLHMIIAASLEEGS